MNTRYRVALQGFGPFERQALESYFRLAKGQTRGFEPADSLAEADLCVADSDKPLAVEQVRAAGRLDQTVFVGAEPPAGAVVHLGRPINPKQVAYALETLLLAQAHGAFALSTSPGVLRVARERARTSTSPGRLDAGPSSTSPGALVGGPITAPSALDALAPEGPASKPPGVRAGGAPATHFPFDVLVIEGRDIAASVLIAQLDRVGCRISVARDADEALRLIAQGAVRIVFCDTQMRGLDGLTLCQQIKSVKKGAPSVVLMAQKVGPSDRVRAQLAGADALLAKPIPADDLLDILRSASNRRRRAR